MSPLLFFIAMDTLAAIIARAMEDGVLSSFGGISAWQQLSIYADDVAFFARPTRPDLWFVREVLELFGEASGLRVSYTKSTITLIHGEQEDRDQVVSLLQCPLMDFPCRYLGL